MPYRLRRKYADQEFFAKTNYTKNAARNKFTRPFTFALNEVREIVRANKYM